MSKLSKVFTHVAALVLLQAGASAIAQDTLDSLMQEVATVRASEQQVFQDRAAKFNAAAPAEQQSMLNEAQARRETLAAASDALSAKFSANELKINELDKQLREKASALGLSEVFGLARQVAGDTATVLEQSLISTQFPAVEGQLDRDDWLRAFATSAEIPTTSDLERMWFELQREMVAGGQVAKYQTKIVEPGGQSVDAEVIRIGPFSVTTGDRFLQYLPSLQSLNVYPRQPPSDIRQYASAISSASDGYVQAIVDSSRGVLMALYVERPTWGQRIENGEDINYVILLVGFVAFLCFLVQLVYLVVVRVGVSAQLKHLDKPTANNPLGRVLLAFKGDPNNIEQDADVAELRISEAVFREVPKLERYQALLRLSVAAGPLLGLIGTVMGMIMTFQAITESGSSDPKLMAEGIGAAMIATVLGLGIAIPLLFANALLTSLSKGVTQVIEEQAAGMLAESIERQRRG
ncbi:MAG: MotA/TolQ/ExbB proton channel family protein [Gammaproteobacteria bacterium]|nr:MotA/TolQ/ExbB proton channel family protein [Gammaproteobacteria bacterium]MBP6051516.1 MotA/TolQ/ExbB proton channel family protein [Pseudomonadales bacterium]MBK6582633.1 MotA/TolQ/ExbB proton channel family protein [Gammaproteobacteria bacterium]MBK7518765.1 MotA/TolQ/ExbB proton channel family protein [Gammaproteobacteria bacterium]MBK7730488.1 MotA/TolQ/ExbB proton channel family protein [Gammaproteobacteria bacterium]